MTETETETISETNKNQTHTKDEPNIPFWGEDPNVLFDIQYVTEFYPSDTMTQAQKLNAITRTVIIMTVAGSFFTNYFRLWVIALMTLAAIWYLYYYQSKVKKVRFAENFTNEEKVKETMTSQELPQDLFDAPKPNNPFGNPLLTDFNNAENKKPAPPSYNKRINDKIVTQSKQSILDNNPEQPYITNKLFSGLDDNLAYEQSMRPFYSLPNTTIPNDQTAFADFCYGSMVSCKEGNAFACARNLTNHMNV